MTLAEIKKLTDPKQLAKLAKNKNASEAELYAIAKNALTPRAVLEKLAEESKFQAVREAAKNNLYANENLRKESEAIARAEAAAIEGMFSMRDVKPGLKGVSILGQLFALGPVQSVALPAVGMAAVHAVAPVVGGATCVAVVLGVLSKLSRKIKGKAGDKELQATVDESRETLVAIAKKADAHNAQLAKETQLSIAV